MVYTSTSLALAALEFFVHLDPSVAPDDLVSVAATIPGDVGVERMSVDSFANDWKTIDHPTLRTLGADWIRSNRSMALEVPSIVVEGDWNVLLNPAHPEFGKITLEVPKPWHFDRRMFR